MNAEKEADCFAILKSLELIQETRVQKLIFQHLSKNLFLLTTYFRYAKQFYIPRYNNDTENLFRQINLRLKLWNMFRSKVNAEHYLKAWALARRFTKFTECKIGMNKLKNGKAPLKLTGVDIAGIDYLKL